MLLKFKGGSLLNSINSTYLSPIPFGKCNIVMINYYDEICEKCTPYSVCTRSIDRDSVDNYNQTDRPTDVYPTFY